MVEYTRTKGTRNFTITRDGSRTRSGKKRIRCYALTVENCGTVTRIPVSRKELNWLTEQIYRIITTEGKHQS